MHYKRELKVKIEPSLKEEMFDLMTGFKGSNCWSGGCALTIRELEQVRDEICDFLINQTKKDK